MVLQHEGYSVYTQHHPSPTESISGFELFLDAGTEVWCLSGAYVCVLVLIVENVGGGHWGAIGSSRFKRSPEHPDLHSSLPTQTRPPSPQHMRSPISTQDRRGWFYTQTTNIHNISESLLLSVRAAAPAGPALRPHPVAAIAEMGNRVGVAGENNGKWSHTSGSLGCKDGELGTPLQASLMLKFRFLLCFSQA